MERNEVKYVPVEQCKAQGNFVQAICFKPKKAPIVCIILGMLMFIPNNLYIRILGLFFILMAFAVLKLVKDYKVMDIFDQGVMIYGDQEAKLAYFFTYDEMESWVVNHDNGHDTIEFKLNDGTIIIKDTFEAEKAYRTLYSLVKEKDEKYLNALKDREKPLSIPDAMNNIRNSFKKNKKD